MDDWALNRIPRGNSVVTNAKKTEWVLDELLETD